MVLAEQIKEIEQRREALERCLDIDQKRIDLRNEEEKTQEPNFWDNPDKAREQLRKVAGIKAWVEDYDAIRKDAEDLQLMPDFVKEGVVSEEEMDAHYAATLEKIEKSAGSPLFGPKSRRHAERIRKNGVRKGFSATIATKSYLLNYKELAIRDAKNRQTRNGKLKNRPKKSDMTIYLIYLHNGQDRFGMGCEQIRRFAPISHCIFAKSLLTHNLKPKSWNNQKCGSCRTS